MSRHCFASTGAIAAGLVWSSLLAGCAKAVDKPQPVPLAYSPDETVHGKTHEEWAAAWWQWAFSIPSTRSPVLDPTGEFAGEGQNGPVWFLAGTKSAIGAQSGVTERKLTMPAGKAIFFPIITVIMSQDEVRSEAELNEKIRRWVDNMDQLAVSVDGQAVPNLANHRAETKLFSVTGPPDPAEAVFAGGKRDRMKAGGYWVMLKPLPPGEHTIHFQGRGSYQARPHQVNLAYRITVK